MRIFTAVLLILLLAFVALPLLAQETELTEEAPLPVVIGDSVIEVPDSADVQAGLELQFAAFATVLITAIWNLLYIPVAAPLVELLASVSKRLPFLDKVSSPTLAFTFTVLAWIGYVLVTQLGYADRFGDMITAITTIATVVFGIPVTQAAATKIHGFAQTYSIPVFGYSRTPSATRQLADAIADAIDAGLKSSANGVDNSPEGEKQLVPIAERGN